MGIKLKTRIIKSKKQQEDIVALKAKKKTLQFELDTLNDKKHELKGKLQGMRC